MSEGDASDEGQLDTEIQEIEFKRLTADCGRGDFRCGAPDLDYFFRNDAWDSHCRMRFQVYTAHFIDNPDPMGFYALTILQKDLKVVHPRKQHLCYARNKIFPVMRLGWLAVDERYQHRGYGTILLGSVIEHVREVAIRTGIFGMTLTAIDHDAARLYGRMGFQSYGTNPLDMLLESRAILDLDPSE